MKASDFFKTALGEIDALMKENLTIKEHNLELKEKLLALMLENKKLKEKIEILELNDILK